MSKSKVKNNQTMANQQIIKMIALLGGLVILGVLAFMLLTGSAAPEETTDTDTQTDPTTSLISAADYQSDFAERDHILLDVRTPEEFESGYIDGAVNISVQTLADRLNDVPQDTPIVVYCRSGNRSAQAAQILNEAGYTPVYDMGGIVDWTAAGNPIVQ